MRWFFRLVDIEVYHKSVMETFFAFMCHVTPPRMSRDAVLFLPVSWKLTQNKIGHISLLI